MSEHKSIIHDPHAERMGKGKVGIVGESHIWDGPLSQKGRTTRNWIKFRNNRYAFKN